MYDNVVQASIRLPQGITLAAINLPYQTTPRARGAAIATLDDPSKHPRRGIAATGIGVTALLDRL